MIPIVTWRKRARLSQQQLADKVGLKSRGQIADIERGRQRISTDLAIALDRLSDGALPVASLRPDLHDVRVVRTAAAPEARP